MIVRRVGRGLRYSAIILMALPSGPQRKLLRQMVAFGRALPDKFNQPLPEMMAQLTPDPLPQPLASPNQVRRLSDAVAAWQLKSPLGICLRRSLIRYHFLRQAGQPVQIVFGARIKSQTEGGGVGGHAWITLNGQPYHENPQDYANFAQMYVYPEDGSKK